MRRVLFLSLAALMMLASGSRAGDGNNGQCMGNTCGAGGHGGWHYFWYTVRRDYQRMNSWPDPFVYPDRASVCRHLSAQVQNGWRMQNLMGDHYFTPDSQQLTTAGRERVRWIVTQTPTQHRTVFVQRGVNTDITSARMDAVQKAAANFVSNGALPGVVDTDLQPRGWPADYINTVYGSFEKTTPAPRLPSASSGGSSE